MAEVRRGTFGLALALGVATIFGVGRFARELLNLSCPIRSFTGLQCPGCGSTRCVAAISVGDFGGAARSNPLLFSGLALVYLYVILGTVSPPMFSRVSSWVGERQRHFAICIGAIVISFVVLRNLFGS